MNERLSYSDACMVKYLRTHVLSSIYNRLLAFDLAVSFYKADIGRCRDADLFDNATTDVSTTSAIPDFIVTVTRPGRRTTTASPVTAATSAPVSACNVFITILSIIFVKDNQVLMYLLLLLATDRVRRRPSLPLLRRRRRLWRRQAQPRQCASRAPRHNQEVGVDPSPPCTAVCLIACSCSAEICSCT